MVYMAGVNQSVDTADTYFRQIEKLPISGAGGAKIKLAERTSIASRPIYDFQPLEARAEYARWIVDCPNCNGAEFAFEDNLFLCSSCGNSDIDGRIRKVKMPPDREEIETLLGKRKIVNRHWFPTETVEDLRKENIKMEIEDGLDNT